MVLVIALVIIAACVLAIRSSGSARPLTVPAVVGYTGLFFVGAQVTWAMLLYTGVVPLDEIARSFGMFTDDVVRWYGVIGWVPPSLAALVFAIMLWRRRRFSQRP